MLVPNRFKILGIVCAFVNGIAGLIIGNISAALGWGVAFTFMLADYLESR